MNRKGRIVALSIVTLLIAGWLALASDLIISEIAWAGTAASSADEWIELQNRGDVSVELSGWQLVFGDIVIALGEAVQDTVEVRTMILNPGGFLVLERTDDDAISDITADLIYKGTLSNSGVIIELMNPDGDIVDTAIVSDEAGWPAGTGSSGELAYCTMERASSGEWISNNGIICNGLDAEGAPLNGTPGQMNSFDVLAQWAPSVEITFPSEQGAILSGTEWITWTASDPNGTDSALAISIYISLGEDQEWILLIENLANMGSFSWDTTEQASGENYRLWLRAEDSEGYFGHATSTPFTISNGEDG